MFDFSNFDSNFVFLVSGIFIFFNSLVGIITFFRTGKISSKFKNFIGGFNMSKTTEKKSVSVNDSYAQSFVYEIKQYRLNKSTGELEEMPDKLDLFQLIQSNKDCALKSILQSLEPVDPNQEIIDLKEDLTNDLDDMLSFEEAKLDMCERYGLDPHSSFDTVLAHISAEKARVEGEISALNSLKDKEVNNEVSQKTSPEKVL